MSITTIQSWRHAMSERNSYVFFRVMWLLHASYEMQRKPYAKQSRGFQATVKNFLTIVSYFCYTSGFSATRSISKKSL